MEKRFLVTASLVGIRLDNAVAHYLGIPRSRLKRCIRDQSLRIDGGERSWHQTTREGQEVSFELLPPPVPWEPCDLQIPVLYEDTHLLVLDKPSGIAVHPGSGAPGPTISEGLLWKYPSLGIFPNRTRLGLVHRLDKGTSGVLLVARTMVALAALQSAFKNRRVTKEYLAIIYGVPPRDDYEVDKSIGRHPEKGHRRMVGGKHPKTAFTTVQVLERLQKFSLLAVRPRTGRTHQIRVHLQHLGFPVVGDPQYRLTSSRLLKGESSRLMLHASQLTLDHPFTGVTMTWSAPFPGDMAGFLELARHHGAGTGSGPKGA